MDKLLNCPFCGGDAELINDDYKPDRYGGEYAYLGEDGKSVRCKKCFAKGERVHKKFFRDCFPYNVNDYDKNPALRSECNEKYKEYELEIDNKAKELWNTRYTPKE